MKCPTRIFNFVYTSLLLALLFNACTNDTNTTFASVDTAPSSVFASSSSAGSSSTTQLSSVVESSSSSAATLSQAQSSSVVASRSSSAKSSVIQSSSQIVSSSSSAAKSSQAQSSSVSVDWCATAGNCGTLTDVRDGQKYKWTKIGTQVWMAENLNYSGDNGSGARTYTKGWCFGVGGTDTTQHQESATCQGGYGRFYNWTDAMDIDRTYLVSDAASVIQTPHKGLCPTGWHIPTDGEWRALVKSIRTLSGSLYEGNYLKAVVPGNNDWNSPTFNSGNPYGFSALPASVLSIEPMRTSNHTVFWSASEYSKINGRMQVLNYNYSDLYASITWKSSGLSLRCTEN